VQVGWPGIYLLTAMKPDKAPIVVVVVVITIRVAPAANFVNLMEFIGLMLPQHLLI